MTTRRWVALGTTGAVGSIHLVDEGYEVRLIGDEEPYGVYPQLDIAKSALHAALPAGSERPEFREH